MNALSFSTHTENLGSLADICAADCVENSNTLDRDIAIERGKRALEQLNNPCEMQIYYALKEAGLSRSQIENLAEVILASFGNKFAYVLGGLRLRRAH